MDEKVHVRFDTISSFIVRHCDVCGVDNTITGTCARVVCGYTLYVACRCEACINTCRIWAALGHKPWEG